MTRTEAKQWLIDYVGIEEPTTAQVSALLNHNKDLVAEVTEKVTNEVKESYKDYKSSADYKKLEDEIISLKDESSKTSRYAKYKEAKIKEKWLTHADGLLKDSKNFDEDLKKYVEENPELLEAENKAPTYKKDSFEASKGANKEQKSSFDEAWEKAHPTI